MSIGILIVMALVIIGIGQGFLFTTRNLKIFLGSHIGFLAVIIIVSIIIASNQSGGVRWPWWFFAMYPSVPLLLSLLVGVIGVLITKKK